MSIIVTINLFAESERERKEIMMMILKVHSVNSTTCSVCGFYQITTIIIIIINNLLLQQLQYQESKSLSLSLSLTFVIITLGE